MTGESEFLAQQWMRLVCVCVRFLLGTVEHNPLGERPAVSTASST